MQTIKDESILKQSFMNSGNQQNYEGKQQLAKTPAQSSMLHSVITPKAYFTGLCSWKWGYSDHDLALPAANDSSAIYSQEREGKETGAANGNSNGVPAKQTVHRGIMRLRASCLKHGQCVIGNSLRSWVRRFCFFHSATFSSVWRWQKRTRNWRQWTSGDHFKHWTHLRRELRVSRSSGA